MPARAFKVRYVGSMRSTLPGGAALCTSGVEKVRAEARQVSRGLLQVAGGPEPALRVTDRSGKDVLLVATAAELSCHGLVPGNANFLCLVVQQQQFFYMHVLNLQSSVALEASGALRTAFGGGECEILPAFVVTEKKSGFAAAAARASKRFGRSETKKGERKMSVTTAPPQTQPVGPEEANTLNMPGGQRDFDGVYLGMHPVETLFGTEVVRDAVTANTKERRERNAIDSSDGYGDPTVLSVSMESVRIVDKSSGATLAAEFIKNISYTCVLESTDQVDVFAYIAVNKRLGAVHCHMFHLRPGQGTLAYQAINQAFKLLAADEKTRGTNPFAVTDPKRDPAPDLLFRRQIHRADLKAIQQIGAGQFGSVYTAWQQVKLPSGDVEKTMRAVKLLRNAASDKDKKEFTQEAETMLKLDHVNLVRMIGVAVQQRPWLCVLEYMRYGDLKSLLEMCREKGVPLRYREMLNFSLQLARGCAYLSEQRFVHMDLAARNVLVGDGNTVKVADFGLTRPMEPDKPYLMLRESMRLALKWIAPEAMAKKIFSQASDVWSFGVVLWEIASYGSTPYGRVLTAEIQEKVCGGLRLQRPSTCPEDFYAVMLDSWAAAPRDRPSFAQLDRRLTAMHAANLGEERDVGQAVAQGKATVRGAQVAVTEPSAASKVNLERAAAAGGNSKAFNVSGSSSVSSILAMTGEAKSGKDRKRKPSKKASSGSIMDKLAAAYGQADEGAGAIATVAEEPEPPQPPLPPQLPRRTTTTTAPLKEADGFVLPQPAYENVAAMRNVSSRPSSALIEGDSKLANGGSGTVPGTEPSAEPERNTEPERNPERSTERGIDTADPAAVRNSMVMPDFQSLTSGAVPAAHEEITGFAEFGDLADAPVAAEEIHGFDDMHLDEEQATASPLQPEPVAPAVPLTPQQHDGARVAASASHGGERVDSTAAAKSSMQPPAQPAPTRPGRKMSRLQKDKEDARIRAERAAALESSEEALRAMELRKSMATMFGANEPSRSKIYEALNPKPLAFQTARERQQVEERIELGAVELETLRDYTYESKYRELNAVAEDEDTVEPGPGNTARPTEAALDKMDDGEEEEEEEEEGPLPDFGEFMEEMMAMRKRRAAEEEKRRADLKVAWEAARREEAEARAREMAVIEERERMERAEKERLRDEALVGARLRSEQLVFDFDFSW